MGRSRWEPVVSGLTQLEYITFEQYIARGFSLQLISDRMKIDPLLIATAWGIMNHRASVGDEKRDSA